MHIVIILFILRILSVNCNLIFNDPTFPKFSYNHYDKTKMLSTASPYNIETTCTPKKAWILTRHGTKYPSRVVLKGIKDILVPKIQKLILDVYAKESDKNFSMLDEDKQKTIRKIKTWKNAMAAGTHKDLNEDGKLQMVKLGKRWNSKLNKLTKSLTLEEIEVLSAEEYRCVLSGKKFLSGFFEGDHDEIEIPIALDDDLRLKLVKPAKKRVRVEDPPNSQNFVPVEDIYYRNNSPPMIEKIQKLLFPDHVDNYQEHRDQITGEIVQIMYSACVHIFYYVDVDGSKTDAWCNLFDYADFKLFEEVEDVKYYYQNGYHLEENTKMGNAITNDLLEFIKNSRGLKFKLFIGHTSNILSLITRFNLFRDENKITVDNIHDMTDRKWKSSFMTPLGCNIMVVIYDCGDVTKRVSFYLNETPIEMVMDDGKTCTECPVDDFIHKLEGFNTTEVLHRSPSIIETNEESEMLKKLKKKVGQLEREKLRLIKQEHTESEDIRIHSEDEDTER